MKYLTKVVDIEEVVFYDFLYELRLILVTN